MAYTQAIVDGYNLMKTDPELSMFQMAGLEYARNAVITRVQNAAGLRSLPKIIIVFDGHQGGQKTESTERRGRITIIYSKLGETADEVIKRLAAQAAPGETLVITRDSDIRLNVTGKGATAGIIKRRPAGHSAKIENEDKEGWNNSTRKKGPSRRESKKGRKRGPGNDVYW